MKILPVFFFITACVFRVFPGNLYLELRDETGLLPAGTAGQLTEKALQTASFITPHRVETGPAAAGEDGAFDFLYLLLRVTEGNTGAREDMSVLRFTLECEIFTGFAPGEGQDSPNFPAAAFTFYSGGAGLDSAEAEAVFIEDFQRQLLFELMFQPLLRRDICVLHITNKDVVLSLPREFTLKPGTEFAMTMLAPDGSTEKAGKLVVTKVEKTHALGRMLYSENPVRIGARGEKLSLSGLDTDFSVSILINPGQAAVVLTAMEYVRLAFPWLLPGIGIQMPFFVEQPYTGLIPITILAGVKVPWILQKISLSTTIAGGIGWFFSGNTPYAGLLAAAALNFRLNDRLVLYAQFGYTSWIPFLEGFIFNGYFAGAGLTFSY